MTTARQARRRRRRYYQALAQGQRRHGTQSRAEPVHRVDDLYAKGIAWVAIVVLMIAAIALAASL